MSKSDLEVDGKVIVLPDKKLSDENTAREAIFVEVDPIETSVSLVMTPHLTVVGITCRSSEAKGTWVFRVIFNSS